MIHIREHSSSSYAPRTCHNASQGVTLALAVDFSTAGEKLTTKAAKGLIVHCDALDYENNWLPAARQLYKMLKDNNKQIVNVAGNGIYTFAKHGIVQSDINWMVYDILNKVYEHYEIGHIVSGGQSGADLAGLVAAGKLGIPCTGTWPKGYKMRFENGIDVNHTSEEIMELINGYSE